MNDDKITNDDKTMNDDKTLNDDKTTNDDKAMNDDVLMMALFCLLTFPIKKSVMTTRHDTTCMYPPIPHN